LQIIHHQMTVAQAAPGLPARRIQFQDILEILDGFSELFFRPQNTRDGVHRRNGPLVMSQCLFIRVHGTFEVAHQFRQTTDLKPDLLIERGDFLRGVQWRALLTLRLQGNVAVDLGMSRDVGMMRGDGPGG
jgi:hypothetical protein